MTSMRERWRRLSDRPVSVSHGITVNAKSCGCQVCSVQSNVMASGISFKGASPSDSSDVYCMQ